MKRSTEARRAARRELTRRFQLESLEDRLAMDGAMGAWSIEQLPTYGTYEKFRADIIARADEDFQWYFGREETYYPPVWDEGFDFASDLTPVLYSSSDNQTVFRNALHSELSVSALLSSDGADQTNNQVAGVDEIDRVETDGSYLYVLRNGHLDIVDARNPANPSLASSTAIAGWIEGEYLFGDRLTVISIEVNQPWMVPAIWPPSTAYTMAARSAGTTTVTVFDVSDRTAPRVVEKTQLDGGYVDSRAIDDKVYVVLSSPMPTLPMPRQVCDDGSTQEAGIPPGQWPVFYDAILPSDETRLAGPDDNTGADENGDGSDLAEAEGDDESLIDIVPLSDEEPMLFAYSSIGE
ncbi:MAG TPA: beta-propeller domain-containing protein, partial [Pirellulaceae bacterium]|nr:beta-propeller domain-containing protein [Pirellulaceae bacterium]